jgi:hypothetical protein
MMAEEWMRSTGIVKGQDAVCVETWQNHAGFDCTEWSNVRQLTDLEPEQQLGAHPNQFEVPPGGTYDPTRADHSL